MTTDHVTIRLIDPSGKGFVVDRIHDPVTLDATKTLAHNHMERHMDTCNLPGCQVSGWEVWAYDTEGKRLLWARWPEGR